MTLPQRDTVVDYPAGALHSASTVLHVDLLDDQHAVVLLDRTACHPVDYSWPDQGPDLATLRNEQLEIPVLDSVVAATDGEALYVGRAIPVRKGTEGWAFVVAHLVDAAAIITEGDEVEVVVDGAYRGALSAGHTACHLASLALNEVLSGAWSKPAQTDALGRPDFDGLAVQTTTIGEYSSRDEYRIGKSLRRKGFDPSALDDVAGVETRVNELLTDWLDTGVAVHIERQGELLTSRRTWVCELPTGVARIACGGTHVDSLGALGGVSVELTRTELDGAIGLEMTTTALPGS
jgi:alanyl-tRNA synthetase